MNDINQHHKHLLNKTVLKLTAAMGKFKFDGNMSHEEADALRKEIDQVKGELFSLSDINPDIKHIELFKEATDLLERVLITFTSPYEHLV